MTDPAVTAYLRERARRAGLASGESRRKLRERVTSGEATDEERERYAALCAGLRQIAASGGKARAAKGVPLAYIQDEVFRQGFDPGSDAWEIRVGWMSDAWRWAEARARERRFPVLADVVEIGRRVEREKNRNGLRRCGVRVGNRVCPPWEGVPGLLAELMPRVPGMAPLDFYRELLLIHPFRDGNGRAGKIALAWAADSWRAPLFPPDDFWGAPIRNP